MQRKSIWSELWDKFWERFMFPLIIGEVVVLVIILLRYILTLLHVIINSHWFYSSFGYIGTILWTILFCVLVGYLTIYLFDHVTE